MRNYVPSDTRGFSGVTILNAAPRDLNMSSRPVPTPGISKMKFRPRRSLAPDTAALYLGLMRIAISRRVFHRRRNPINPRNNPKIDLIIHRA